MVKHTLKIIEIGQSQNRHEKPQNIKNTAGDDLRQKSWNRILNDGY